MRVPLWWACRAFLKARHATTFNDSGAPPHAINAKSCFTIHAMHANSAPDFFAIEDLVFFFWASG
eukprot:1968916-Amphidinium_carterae.1